MDGSVPGNDGPRRPGCPEHCLEFGGTLDGLRPRLFAVVPVVRPELRRVESWTNEMHAGVEVEERFRSRCRSLPAFGPGAGRVAPGPTSRTEPALPLRDGEFRRDLPKTPTPVTKLALSRREAARLLGIDRGRTLGVLIASGKLRVVPWGTGERIPLVDVERLAREGFTLPSPGSPGRPPASRRRRDHARGRDKVAGLTDAQVRVRLAEF